MGDPLRKVQPGQPVRIPARTFNTFIDAAQDYLQRRQNVGGDPLTTRLRSGIVLVENASGADRGRFEILGVDDVVISQADNADEFYNRPVLSGITPDTDVHAGRFVVLAEPIASGKIGHAWAFGMCPVQVDMQDADHTACEIKDATTANLISHTSGTARILTVESGTGVKWAVVRIGAGGGLPDGTATYQVLSWDNTDKAWGPDWVRAH